MTIYPLTFQMGFLELTGYGLMMMVGFLMAGWVLQRELRRRALDEEYASDIIVAGVIGGILGAKLWYVVLTQDLGALASRSGLVWYGGFIGGTLAVYLNGLRQRVPTRFTMDLVAPGLAIGYALGRIGCFMVQDDYGRPTDLPWGLRFPEGLPPTTAHRLNADFGIPIPDGINPLDVVAVHPTQLYEAAAMMLAFWLLWRLRDHGRGTGWLMGAYLLFAGTERFLVEILRAKDDRFLAGFTVAQLTSIVIATVGVIIMARFAKPDEVAIPANSILQAPKTT